MIIEKVKKRKVNDEKRNVFFFLERRVGVRLHRWKIQGLNSPIDSIRQLKKRTFLMNCLLVIPWFLENTLEDIVSV